MKWAETAVRKSERKDGSETSYDVGGQTKLMQLDPAGGPLGVLVSSGSRGPLSRTV